jgi:hypothetical protein
MTTTATATSRDAAVAAARLGCAVFPCRPRDKRPAVPGWEHRACAVTQIVARYWPSDRHNIGIACGPSRIVVIDLDTHNPLPGDWRLPGIRDGRDVLAQLAEWAGQPWPATRTVRTPTGGLHLHFAAPEGIEIRNSAGRIAPLVDVRGAGGYVLAPGSVLDERAYPGNPGGAALVRGGRAYELENDGEPAPLPAWLAALAGPAGPPRPPSQATRPAGTAGTRLRGLVATVRGGQPGDRNGPLYWAGRRAAEMIAAGEIEREAAEESLIAAALEAGLRGGEREARRTFASALRGGGL